MVIQIKPGDSIILVEALAERANALTQKLETAEGQHPDVVLMLQRKRDSTLRLLGLVVEQRAGL